MKAKLLIFSMALAIMTTFVGCRQNVTTPIETTPTTAAVATAVTPTTTGTIGEATINENKDEIIETGVTTDTAAVEGNTPTAQIVKTSLSANTLSLGSMGNNDITKLDNQKIGWGLGSNTDPNGRPVDAIIANEKYKAFNARFIEENEKKIYLTFDEGYENGYTSVILDTLKNKGVNATFFITYDYAKSSPELVERMIKEGHAIGNHSYTHPSFPDCNVREVTEEITYLHDYVEKNFGYKMTVMRFPKGEFSNRTLAIANSLGYKSIFWSFAHVDWDVKNQPSKEETYKRITNGTHPGAIILLHAVSSANAESLGDVIDFWKLNGYELAVYTN